VSVIELDAVEKGYDLPGGRRVVLAGVDLTVGRGEIVALAGRSGTGKTTLLTVVVGWEQPDAGTATLLGDPERRPDRPWRELAILPQTLGLLDELTIAENIGLPLRLATAPRATEPGALMRRLGIDHLARRFPDEVSLGEQQRAALARAAVVGPDVLVADEPIAHQNRAWAEEMMRLFVDLAAAGTTCLLATHNEIAFASADRVVVLDAGRLTDLPR
jgi:putative ABC transport system ATP-binding protein